MLKKEAAPIGGLQASTVIIHHQEKNPKVSTKRTSGPVGGTVGVTYRCPSIDVYMKMIIKGKPIGHHVFTIGKTVGTPIEHL